MHDIFDWSNATVGAVGLVLTVGAIWQATGAKKAALEAREAVFQRNASDSLAEVSRLAESCIEYLSLERPIEAGIRARDLAIRISRDRARFMRYVAADSSKLELLESVFRQLAVRLAEGRFLEDKDKAQTAIRDVADALNGLNAIHGRLLGRMDKEDK